MRELRTGALRLGLEFSSIIYWLVYLDGLLKLCVSVSHQQNGHDTHSRPVSMKPGNRHEAENTHLQPEVVIC